MTYDEAVQESQIYRFPRGLGEFVAFNEDSDEIWRFYPASTEPGDAPEIAWILDTRRGTILTWEEYAGWNHGPTVVPSEIEHVGPWAAK
jgi:hypothetical protein